MKKLAGVALLAVLCLVPLAGASIEPRIVFVTDVGAGNDIATATPDGADFRNLTGPVAMTWRYEDTPAWSPDGGHIAFVSHRDSSQGQEIYTMSADGSDQRRLTFTSGNGTDWNQFPCYLPDGRIVWDHSGAAWVMNADGSGQRPVAPPHSGRAECSPTRNEIAYDDAGSIRVMNVDSGTVATLGATTTNAYFTWSPDGGEVAWADGKLHAAHRDGTGARTISDATIIGDLDWSPDGKTIAVTAPRTFPTPGGRFSTGTEYEVDAVDVASGDVSALTGPPNETSPETGLGGMTPIWWPHGERISFTSTRPDDGRSYQLWEMNPDGTCQTHVLAGHSVLAPQFAPGSSAAGPLECVDLDTQIDSNVQVVGLRSVVPATVTIWNHGNEAAHPTLTVRTQNGVLSAVDGASCLAPGPQLTCSLAEIAPGASATVHVRASHFSAGPLGVTASVQTPEVDSEAWNNERSFGRPVLPCNWIGTLHADTYVGTPAANRVCARAGADRISTLGGNDYIDAGAGADVIYPGPGHDTVYAKDGNDVIYARDGMRDYIDCGGQVDTVYADRVDTTVNCERVYRR